MDDSNSKLTKNGELIQFDGKKEKWNNSLKWI